MPDSLQKVFLFLQYALQVDSCHQLGGLYLFKMLGRVVVRLV